MLYEVITFDFLRAEAAGERARELLVHRRLDPGQVLRRKDRRQPEARDLVAASRLEPGIHVV